MAGFMRAIRSLLSPSGGGGLDLPNLGMRSSGFDPPPEPTEAPRLSQSYEPEPSPFRGEEPEDPWNAGMSRVDMDLERPGWDDPPPRGHPVYGDEGMEQQNLIDPELMEMGPDRGLLMEDPIYKAYTTNDWRDRRPLENRYRRGYRKFDTAFNKLEGDTRLPVLEEREGFFPHHPNQDPRRALLADVRDFERSGDLGDAPSTQMQLTEQALQQALRTRELGPPPTQTRLGLGGSAFDEDAPTPPVTFYDEYMTGRSGGKPPSLEEMDPPGWDLPDDGGAYTPMGEGFTSRTFEPDVDFEPMAESPPSRPMPSDRHLRWPQLLSKKLYG